MTTTAKPTSDFLTTAVQSAKRRIFSQVPNKQQVELVSDGSVKRRTKWVLFTAAFIDLSGATAILAGMRVQDLHIKMAETTSFTDLRYPEAIGKAL